MSDTLPYSTLAPAESRQSGFRHKKLLVITGDTLLPPRCIYCGTPHVAPPISIPFQTRQSFQLPDSSLPPVVHIFATLCPRHQNRRSTFHIAVLSSLSTAILAIIAAGALLHAGTVMHAAAEIVLPTGVAFLLLAAILHWLGTNRPSLKTIRHSACYIRGIHPAVLNELLPYPPTNT